jgi:DNA-binding IclR family transcriptional regulator
MTVKSADRTLSVFEAFADIGRPLSLSEVAREIGIPVSSCHGLLRALEDRGYMNCFEPRGTYFPTHRLLQVARAISDKDPISAGVRNELEKLRDETGETVVLAKRKELQVVFLEVFESNKQVRYVAQAGEVRDLHASSLGKALLAAMSVDERARVLKRIPYRRHTDKTIASSRALEEVIEAGLSAGTFTNFGESVEDLYAMARGVRIGGNVFAVAVIGPAVRIEKDEKRIASLLERACRAIGDKPS